MRARCPATSDREPVDGLSLPRRRYRGYPSSRRHQGSLSFRQYCSEPTKSSVMDRRNSRSRCSSLETSASGHPAYNLGPVILLQLAHALVAQAWSITVLSAPSAPSPIRKTRSARRHSPGSVRLARRVTLVPLPGKNDHVHDSLARDVPHVPDFPNAWAPPSSQRMGRSAGKKTAPRSGAEG